MLAELAEFGTPVERHAPDSSGHLPRIVDATGVDDVGARARGMEMLHGLLKLGDCLIA